jgi:hypothetical protein
VVRIRFVAAAALAASLAGCSFFAPSDHSARYQESGGPGAARPAQSVQLAALPGYLSDQDIVPARPALAPVRVSQPRRVLTFADLIQPRPLGELKPMGTPLRAESYTLADLVEDRAWRKRTSQRLERLFQ